MSVAYFKERLKNANEINTERKEMEEIEAIEKMEWDRSFKDLERFLERDETPRGEGNRHTHETRIRLSVEKIARMEAERLGLNAMPDWASTDWRMEAMRPIAMHPGQTRVKDLRDNFVYHLYGKNVFSGGEVRTYAQFSVHFAMRAIVRLLAEVPGADALLREVEPEWPIEATKQDAINFYRHLEGLQDQLDSDIAYDDRTHPLNVVTDPFELANMMRDWVPNIDRLAESLLMTYSDAVRIQRAYCEAEGLRYHDGTLPDEDGAVPLRRLIENWPEELRIQQALLEYSEPDSGSIKEISKKYRIPERRFGALVKEKGLDRKSGPRAGKEVA